MAQKQTGKTALVESEILRVDTGLTKSQVQAFFTATPKDKILTRPAKGGGEWKYVSGGYVTQVLNQLFGFYWSFEIKTSMEEALKTASSGTVVVQGCLKVKVGETWITKEQYGRKEVAFKKGTKEPLDFGNDLKAAATDAKKKCAAELGLFQDVYNQENFIEAEIITQAELDTRRQEAINAAVASLNAAINLEALRLAFVNTGALMSEAEVIAAKDKRKQELQYEAA